MYEHFLYQSESRIMTKAMIYINQSSSWNVPLVIPGGWQPDRYADYPDVMT